MKEMPLIVSGISTPAYLLVLISNRYRGYIYMGCFYGCRSFVEDQSREENLYNYWELQTFSAADYPYRLKYDLCLPIRYCVTLISLERILLYVVLLPKCGWSMRKCRYRNSGDCYRPLCHQYA